MADGRFGPFTGNQLTIILLAAIAAAGFPTTLFAVAAYTNSVVMDASTGDRARVIRGALKVGDGLGPLTVDGTVSAPLARPDAVFSTYARAGETCSTVYQPPSGSAAVVTEANFTVELFSGSGIVAPRLFVGRPDPVSSTSRSPPLRPATECSTRASAPASPFPPVRP